MSDVTSSIKLAVDSTDVVSAGQDLDKLAASGKKAEAAASGLKTGFDGLGASASVAASGIGKAATSADAITSAINKSGSSAAEAARKILDMNSATERAASAARSLSVDLSSIGTSLGASAFSGLEKIDKYGETLKALSFEAKFASVELDGIGTALGISANKAAQAEAALKSLTAASGEVGGGLASIIRSGDAAAASLANTSAATKTLSVNLDNVGTSLGASGFKGVAELDRLGTSLGAASGEAKKFAGFVKQIDTSELDRAGLGLGAYATKAKQAFTATAAAKPAAENVKALGEATKLTGYQTAQLSAQLQDFFVQVQAGGSPLTALIQQGSQLSAVFGGFRGAFAAIGSLLTPFAVGAAAVAAAVGTIGYGFIAGKAQSDALARSLALTGNAAGITEGKFNTFARSIAESTKTSIGSAKDTLGELVASGRFTSDSLVAVGTATQKLSRATGQSASDIAKQFISLTDGVARGAEGLNKSYNFLTASQFAYIKSLEDSGNVQGAVQATIEALNSRLGEQTQKVGPLTELWNKFSRAISDSDDAVKSLGRNASLTDQIDAAQKKLANFDTANKAFTGATAARTTAPESKADLQARLDTLREAARLEDSAAINVGKRVAQEQAGLQFEKIRLQTLSAQEQLVEQIANATAKADAGGVSAADRAKVINDIVQGSRAFQLSVAERVAALNSGVGAANEALKTGIDQLQSQANRGLISQLDLIQQVADLEVKAAINDKARLQGLLNVAKQQKDNFAEVLSLQGQLAENAKRTAGIEIKAQLDITDAIEKRKLAIYLLTIAEKEAQDQEYFQYLQQLDKVKETLVNKTVQYNQSIADSAERQQLEADLIGASNAERERAIALLEIEQDRRKRLYEIENSSALSPSEKEVETKNLNEAAAKASANAVQKINLDSWRQTYDSISQGLTDTIISGGKNGAQSIKDLFGRLVLEPIVRATIQPLAAAATSAITGSSALSVAGSAASLASGGSALAGSSSLFGSIATTTSSAYKSLITYATPAVVAYASYQIGKGIANGFQIGGSGISNLINSLGAVGGLVNRLFGTKLGDSGVQGTLGGSSGFSGNAFQDIKGGFFRSDSTKTSALDPQVQTLLEDSVKQVQDQTAKYAQALGLPVDAIKTFTQDIKVSLKDLSADQITQKLTETLTDFGKNLVKPLAESLDPFRKAGEDTATTLGRLADALTGVNPALQQLKLKLFDVSVSGADAASQLADLFGGVGNLTQAASSYYQKYYKDAERANIATQKISDVLGDFGLKLPDTREAFRALVESQDLTTDSGRKAFTALLGVADAFDQVQTAGEEASKAAKKLADDLQTAISNALPKFQTPQQQTATAYQSIADQLKQAGVLTATQDLAAVLQAATKDQILAFAESFVSLGDVSVEAKTAVVNAASALADLKDKAADASKALQDALKSAIDTALPKFQTPEQRTRTQYQNIANQLQQAGVLTGTPDLASVLAGADKKAIFDFASQFVQLADVSDAAKVAVVNAASALADIKDAAAQAAKDLQTADLQSQIDAITKAFGDLSVVDTTQTISQQFVANKQQLESLQQSLANLLGTVGKSVQDTLSDLLASQRAIASFRSSLLDSIGAARLRGLSPTDRIQALRVQESSLFGQLSTASEPVAVAQKLQGVILDRIKAEADLRQTAEQAAFDLAKKARSTQIDTLKAQIDGYQRLQKLAQDISQFTGSLRFSDLSPLSFGDQLTAARTLFEQTLAAAKGGDAVAQGNLTGNARAFLDEARNYYASSAAYNEIFQQVTGSLDALGLAGANSDPQIQQLNAQLDSLTALNELQTTVVDTSADEVAALTRVYDILGKREDEAKKAVDDQTELAKKQIEKLKDVVDGQEAQIRQQASIYEGLKKQLDDLNATFAAQLSNTTLLSNNPGVVAGG